MRRLREFITGWAATLRIMIFERDLYRHLREPMDMSDFIEVGPPGESPDAEGRTS
jgi:hypothetical protein